MRETDRLDRQFDVTVFWGVEEELAVVSVTASGKPDCPRTGKRCSRKSLSLRKEKRMSHRDSIAKFVLMDCFERTDRPCNSGCRRHIKLSSSLRVLRKRSALSTCNFIHASGTIKVRFCNIHYASDSTFLVRSSKGSDE